MLDRRLSRGAIATLVLVSIAAIGGVSTGSDSGLGHRARPPGDLAMSPHPASVLLDRYERYLTSRDLASFRREVSIRYTEGTLARLTRADDAGTRRAAVFALGLLGGFESNATVAAGLKDRDPAVRSLASEALWAIWMRADTPENNAELVAVQNLIHRGRADEAVRRADLLIARSPRFAEAWNQRAIARFLSGDLAASVADCRRVLELNPYHFGALSGMGQCQLGLGLRADAVRTFRRALELQPHSRDLRETLLVLEGQGG